MLNRYLNRDNAPLLGDQREIRLFTSEFGPPNTLIPNLTHIRKIRAFKSEMVVYGTLKVGHCSFEGFYSDRRPDVVYLRNANSISVIADQACNEAERLLLRLVREIVTRVLETRGMIAFHGGAQVVGRDCGALIVGPSGSGKTTLLIHLADLFSARFLCNDRVIVDPSTGRLFYSPLPVRIGLDAARHWRALQRLVSSGETLERPHSCEAINYVSNGRARDLDIENIKIELNPVEFCRLSKTSAVSSCALSMIFVPRFSSSPKVVLRPLSRNEVIQHLKNECRTGYDQMWPNPWIENRPPIHLDAIEDAIHDLAKRVPALELQYGPGSRDALLSTLSGLFT